MAVVVVTDSAAGLPPDLVAELGVEVVPLHVLVGERQIQEGMDALMKDRTTFVIAHRLSTIRNSDMIMVLEHGRIIERGTHTELLQRQGRYYELYTGKAELD